MKSNEWAFAISSASAVLIFLTSFIRVVLEIDRRRLDDLIFCLWCVVLSYLVAGLILTLFS